MTVRLQRSQVVIFDYQDASSCVQALAAFWNAVRRGACLTSKRSLGASRNQLYLRVRFRGIKKGAQMDEALTAKAASAIQDVRGTVAGVQQIMAEQSVAQS
jgi:hypothetical protein